MFDLADAQLKYNIEVVLMQMLNSGKKTSHHVSYTIIKRH